MKRALYFLRDILCVALICLASHWMLLLNDGFFWDDNLLYVLLEGGHYEELTNWFLEMGLPLNIVFFRAVDFLFGVSAHRAVSFFTIFLSAVFLNYLYRHYAGKGKSLSLIFVAFYVTLFPFRTTVLLSTLQYQVMLLFFIVAVFIRVKFGAHDRRWVRLLALSIFSIFSFVSFNVASILVLYYFYLIFEYFSTREYKISALSLRGIVGFVRCNLIIFLIPLVYWLIKNLYFPTHGLYVGYNKIDFDLYRMYNSGVYFYWGIFGSGVVKNVAMHAPMFFPVLGLLFILALIFPRLSGGRAVVIPRIELRRSLLIGWSVAFLLISAIPYLVVQTSPRFQGWESRHYLLFTLSLPVFVFVVMVLYLDRLRLILGEVSVGVIARPLIFCVGLVGVVSSSNVYLDFQGAAIKQWATVENLKIKPELKKYSSFWIDDQIGDFSRRGFGWYEATHQNWYEWSAVFTKAWGAQKWYGNNIDEGKAYHVKMLRYGASDINPDGDVCFLSLRNIARSDQFVVIRDYWKLKYFGTERQLREYLLGIVYIEPCQPSVE